MNKLFFFLSLVMLTCVVHAQIYKWVDSQGNVHFSDIPHQGAEVISIPDGPNDSSLSAVPPQIPKEMEEEQPPENVRHAYTRIMITEPEGGATIRNNQGFTKVIAKVKPKLLPGDKLQLLYDNTVLGDPQKNLDFEIDGMYRGSHTVAVQVVDSKGNVIDGSEPVTIYVFRPRVGMVPGTRVN